ncbi:MAG: Mth938-like domain-containing protein [Nanoarchaeota archaeon]
MIQEFKYGMFKIDNKQFYDNVKLIGSKIKLWECKERQITMNDLEDLLEINPELLIIGQGPGGLIAVADDIKDVMRMRKIVLKVDKSQNACELYNRALKDGKRVAAIIPARG